MLLKRLISLFLLMKIGALHAANPHSAPQAKAPEGAVNQKLPVQTVAFRFLVGFSCQQMDLPTDAHSLTNYMWDVLMRVDRGDFSFALFRDTLLSQWKTYEEGQQGVGYLPKLQYTTKALELDNAHEPLSKFKNPILPALDRIALLTQIPVGSDEKIFDLYARRRSAIDDMIDDLALWAKSKNFLEASNGFKPVPRAVCEKRAQTDITQGWKYRSEVFEREKKLRKPETDENFKYRNHANVSMPLYKPDSNYLPISAHTMADRFVKGLWCDDFQFLYWEALYRIVKGEFSSSQFKAAVKEHLNLFYNKDWLGGENASQKAIDSEMNLGLRKLTEDSLLGIIHGINVDDYNFVFENLDPKVPVMRAVRNNGLPSHLSERTLEEKWQYIIKNSSKYWAMEQKLVNWQQRHLLKVSPQPFNSLMAARRNCAEKPELRTGKEVYTQLRNNIAALSADEAKKIEAEKERLLLASTQSEKNDVTALENKIPELKSKLFNQEHARVANLLSGQDLGHPKNYRELASVGTKAYDKILEDDLEKLKAAHVQELKSIEQKLSDENARHKEAKQEAFRSKLEDIDRFNGEMIEWSGKKFEETYNMSGFKGACETKAGTTWSNNRTMMMLYREFAREYSEYIVKQNFEDRKSNPTAAAKKLKSKRDQLLKSFRLFFYMACAESDFDPIYVYPYVKDVSVASDYAKRYKELRFSNVMALKAHIHANRGTVLTKPEANAGIYQKSPDRFIQVKLN